MVLEPQHLPRIDGFRAKASVKLEWFQSRIAHLLVVPQESEVSFPQGEGHAGDGFWEAERLCSLPPVFGLYHALAPTQGRHISVQHVQIQFPSPYPGNLFGHIEDLMYL